MPWGPWERLKYLELLVQILNFFSIQFKTALKMHQIKTCLIISFKGFLSTLKKKIDVVYLALS